MLEHADCQSRQDIDERDHDAGDGVAADELAGTVHGPVEVGLLGHLFAAAAGLVLRDESGIQIGVDRHLLARHAVQREPRSHFADAGGTLGDDQKLNRDQDREDRKPNEELPAGDELAERLNHVPGGGRPVLGSAQRISRVEATFNTSRASVVPNRTDGNTLKSSGRLT